MAYDFIAGASFSYAGTLQLTGPTPGGTSGINGNQPDFSRTSVAAQLYDQTGETLVGTITVTNNSVETMPASNGTYFLTASPDQTITWPLGKLQLILQVILDTSTVIYSDPIWFRVKATPMATGTSS